MPRPKCGCARSRSKVPVTIGRGENNGTTITYTNVVRRWVRLGDWVGKSEVVQHAAEGPADRRDRFSCRHRAARRYKLAQADAGRLAGRHPLIFFCCGLVACAIARSFVHVDKRLTATHDSSGQGLVSGTAFSHSASKEMRRRVSRPRSGTRKKAGCKAGLRALGIEPYAEATGPVHSSPGGLGG